MYFTDNKYWHIAHHEYRKEIEQLTVVLWSLWSWLSLRAEWLPLSAIFRGPPNLDQICLTSRTKTPYVSIPQASRCVIPSCRIYASSIPSIQSSRLMVYSREKCGVLQWMDSVSGGWWNYSTNEYCYRKQCRHTCRRLANIADTYPQVTVV